MFATGANGSVDTRSDWIIRTSTERSLAVLERAMRLRRPVVLLTGAGTSVDAGVPLASQISQYLIQVSKLVERRNFFSVRRFVEENRWPSRHDVRIDLMLSLNSMLDPIMEDAERVASQNAMVYELRHTSPTLAYTLDDLFKTFRSSGSNLDKQKYYDALSAFAQLLGSRAPSNVSYRSLLFHMCDNEQPLIDSCFDHFIRDRSPTTTHQFLVFLTQLLNCRVILTTNFDPLLENAFALEGLRPTVFEIQGEGTIPSPQLLLSQPLSVVKLHGGRHQMKTGFDLDDPLSTAGLTSFRGMFDQLGKPNPSLRPLLIVVGYSGSDRRVMDIVSGHISSWRPAINDHADPAVLWLGRKAGPPLLLKQAVLTHATILGRGAGSANANCFPTLYQRYQEGRLFFIEAYQRLTGRFPVARNFYQAINFVPHTTVNDDDAKEIGTEFKQSKKVAIVTDVAKRGSSSRLAAMAEVAEASGYTLIWIDMSETPGISALADVLSERLRKFDFRLQPLRRPQLLRGLLERLHSPQSPDACEVEDYEFETVVHWLQMALRRGRYYIALDSADEFPASHGTLTAGDAFQKRERDLFSRLIERLRLEQDRIGDSRIAIATAIGSPGHPVRIEGDLAPHHVFNEAWKRKKSDSQRPLTLYHRWKRGWPSVGSHSKSPPLAAIHCHTLLLAVAVCSRRIRSEAMLVWTTGGLLSEVHRAGRKQFPIRDLWNAMRSPLKSGQTLDTLSNVSFNDPELTRKIIFLLTADRPGSRERLADFEEWLPSVEAADDLITTGGADDKESVSPEKWLYRVEGGYHWMHRSVREALYGQLAKKHSEFVCWIHHRIALFNHDELYDRSKDPRAFLEYLYHRTATLKYACNKGYFPFALHWFRRVIVSLQREKSTLMARVRLPSLIHELLLMQSVVEEELITNWQRAKYKPSQDQRDEIRRLVSELWGMIGDFLLAGGHPHSAVQCFLSKLQYLTSNSLTVERPISLGEAVRKDSGLIDRALSILPDIPQQRGHASSPNVRAVCDGVSIRKGLSDLVNAVQDPLIVEDWAMICKKAKDEDWADLTDKSLTRKARFEICERVYSHRSISHWIDWHVDLENGSSLGGEIYFASGSQEQGEKEVASGLLKRNMEFQLLRSTSQSAFLSGARFISAWSKWSCGTSHKAFRYEMPQKTTQKPFITFSPNRLQNVLRLTRRRRRHECYRICILARSLSIDPNEQTEEWFVDSLFDEAEAVLLRQGEPADFQALAITRLLYADHCLRRAESCVRRFASGMPRQAARTRPSIPLICDSIKSDQAEQCRDDREKLDWYRDKARQLISMAEPLLEEGRGENRWRFFLLLTQARLQMMSALCRGPDADNRALDDLHWAGRFLASAMTNCGRRTDRRRILTHWWIALKDYNRTFVSESDWETHWARVTSRLGVRWISSPDPISES